MNFEVAAERRVCEVCAPGLRCVSVRNDLELATQKEIKQNQLKWSEKMNFDDSNSTTACDRIARLVERYQLAATLSRLKCVSANAILGLDCRRYQRNGFWTLRHGDSQSSFVDSARTKSSRSFREAPLDDFHEGPTFKGSHLADKNSIINSSSN